jgi:hypothetical protein
MAGEGESRPEPREELERAKLSLEVESLRRRGELETQRLLLEIKDLKRPWWQRPGYLGVLLPTLIAITTVYTGYKRGYFENESTIIELRKERLQREEEDQRSKLNQTIENYKKATKDFSDLKAREENEKAALQQIGSDLKAARDRQDELKERNTVLENRYRSEREKLEQVVLARVRAFVEGPDDERPGLTELVDLLEQQDEFQQMRVDFVKTRLNQNLSPFLRGNLLLALYEATHQSSWREDLFRLAKDNPTQKPAGFWSLFRDLDEFPTENSQPGTHEAIGSLLSDLIGYQGMRPEAQVSILVLLR